MRDFWTPNHKYQLVDLLSKIYPNDKNKFMRMNKKRLYAVLYSVRSR